MTSLKTLGALIIALSIGAAPAYAQTLDVGASADVNVGDSASAGADASVDASTQTEDDGEPSDEDASSDDDTGFSVSRLDASVTNSTGAGISASSVNTNSDLEAFAASTLRANDSFESVDVSSEGLTFKYKEDARLFGFIPHRVTSRVEVSADGTVRVTRPWYAFLTAGLSADTTASIESKVRSALAASGSMDARAQAMVLAEIASALSGSAEATAETSAN